MTEATPARRRIVVGVDGSDYSKLALRWAARLAPAEHAVIDVIGAWEYPAAWGVEVVPIGYDPRADTEKIVGETVDEVFGADRPIGMTVWIREGDAAHLLIEASKTALLVVVGSRGVGGFMGVLLGSVSGKVAEHAACPVLVVHDKSEKAS